MKIMETLKDWTVSLQRLFRAGEWDNEDLSQHFRDPYKDMDFLHDEEMERLMKTMEEIRGDNTAYH